MRTFLTRARPVALLARARGPATRGPRRLRLERALDGTPAPVSRRRWGGRDRAGACHGG
jgi:hypothetical protein